MRRVAFHCSLQALVIILPIRTARLVLNLSLLVNGDSLAEMGANPRIRTIDNVHNLEASRNASECSRRQSKCRPSKSSIGQLVRPPKTSAATAPSSVVRIFLWNSRCRLSWLGAIPRRHPCGSIRGWLSYGLSGRPKQYF